MTIIDPSAVFGDVKVGPGESATSVDTCTFTVDRSEAIDPRAIAWHVTAELFETNAKMEHTLSAALPLEQPTGFNGLRTLAKKWLWQGTAGGIAEDNIQDGTVNLLDFARLASSWLGSE